MGVQLARDAAWEEFSSEAQMITNSSCLIKSSGTDHARKKNAYGHIPGWPHDDAKIIMKTKPTYTQELVRAIIVIAAELDELLHCVSARHGTVSKRKAIVYVCV